MNHFNVTVKRILLYVFGLFFLSLGVSFSIEAAFGVSPVSSLAYAFALTSGLSVGMTTVIANILFIILQIILSRRIDIKEYSVQLIIAFLFGFFMDATLFLVQLLPSPNTIIIRILFLIVSLFIVGIGLLLYFNAKFPLMPYDALTYVISNKFQLPFTKAKVSSDLLNVGVAGAVCLVFIQSFGSIGIGTLIAAYFIGKILGWMMKKWKEPLLEWVYKQNENTNLQQ